VGVPFVSSCVGASICSPTVGVWEDALEDNSSGSCCANRGVSGEPHAGGESCKFVLRPLGGFGELVLGLGRSGKSS